VELGLNNNRLARIIDGLHPGQVVSLTPPLSASETGRAPDMISERMSERLRQPEFGAAPEDLVNEGPRRRPADSSAPREQPESSEPSEPAIGHGPAQSGGDFKEDEDAVHPTSESQPSSSLVQ
jgi:hypothetical protein